MLANRDAILKIAEELTKHIEGISDDGLAEIDGIMVIAAVNYGAVGEDAESGGLFYRCSSARPHVQFGLLRQAERAIDNTIYQETQEHE